MLLAGKWMVPEIIMLSEKKPNTKRQILQAFAHMKNLDLKN
jgi:hypothetical protein